MLPLLVLAAISFQEGDRVPFAHATIAEAVDGLAKLGYTFVPTNEAGTYGRLTHDGSTVTALLDVPPPAHQGDAPTPVRNIQIQTELAFPREIPLDLRATNLGFPTVEKPTLFTPHLGKTVTARGGVRLRPDSTCGEVRAALDGFWREMEDYAHAQGEPLVLVDRPEWSPFRFSDDQILSVADETSLSRVTNAWGWMWRKGGGRSGGGWAFPIDVDGTEVDVLESSEAGHSPGTSFDVGFYLDLPNGVDAEKWISSHRERLSWARLATGVGGPHRVFLRHGFDLRKGMPLRDIRIGIEQFALGLAALQKETATP